MYIIHIYKYIYIYTSCRWQFPPLCLDQISDIRDHAADIRCKETTVNQKLWKWEYPVVRHQILDFGYQTPDITCKTSRNQQTSSRKAHHKSIKNPLTINQYQSESGAAGRPSWTGLGSILPPNAPRSKETSAKKQTKRTRRWMPISIINKLKNCWISVHLLCGCCCEMFIDVEANLEPKPINANQNQNLYPIVDAILDSFFHKLLLKVMGLESLELSKAWKTDVFFIRFAAYSWLEVIADTLANMASAVVQLGSQKGPQINSKKRRQHTGAGNWNPEGP